MSGQFTESCRTLEKANRYQMSGQFTESCRTLVDVAPSKGQGRGRGRDPVSVEYDIPSASQSGGRSQRRVEGYDMPDIAVEDTYLPDSPLVQEEHLIHAFPGGPTDPSILWSFNSHVAAAIWHGEVNIPQ
ncbi:hypothetical protein TEA_005620 [Camellia sinensis var. sinensis]|uniref:Uncharacterized protein n=1 Tax=Camellia sinensis var. sinensis TaxID=542762 RepID=A0A4V6RYT5_CAMSN|nr:hypothetical protein TEA_005620 [Camellia sinensis var. sinensis]